MLHRTYDDQNCSIARSLEVVGERWSMLILRDAFLGLRRFDDFQRSLGVSRAVLSNRLDRLVAEGVLERRRYQENPERYEYRLTPKGLTLHPIIISIVHWGDVHMAGRRRATPSPASGASQPLARAPRKAAPRRQ